MIPFSSPKAVNSLWELSRLPSSRLSSSRHSLRLFHRCPTLPSHSIHWIRTQPAALHNTNCNWTSVCAGGTVTNRHTLVLAYRDTEHWLELTPPYDSRRNLRRNIRIILLLSTSVTWMVNTPLSYSGDQQILWYSGHTDHLSVNLANPLMRKWNNYLK